MWGVVMRLSFGRMAMPIPCATIDRTTPSSATSSVAFGSQSWRAHHARV
jgi:hypothetical protein